MSFGLGLIAACTNKEAPIRASLPVLQITCDAEEINPSDYLVNDLAWLDTSGATIWEGKTKIRIRGNRSAEFPKHSYSIKSRKKESLLELQGNKKWKLNAEYIDKTLMRNKISYDLFRQFTPGNYAPEIQYCVVYMNNQYDGIYALTESVDAHSLALGSEHSGAVLFKAPPVSNPPNEHKERYQNFKQYIEKSIRFKEYSIKAKYKMQDECYFNQRFPDIKKENYADEIYRLTEFIFNSSDVEFSSPLLFSQYFNLENVIDWHLLILVTANGDGTYKNFYMSRKQAGVPYIFTPWDYDHSFGRDGDGEPSKISLIPVENNMVLLHRLMETNAFDYRNKLYTKFLHLKHAGVLTAEHIHDMIDRNVALLKDEITATEKRWPLGAIPYFSQATFETEVARMKNWIVRHLPELEVYLKAQKERSTPLNEKTEFINAPEFPGLLGTSTPK